MLRKLIGGEYDVELLCSSFGLDFRCSGNRARPQDSQSVDSGDWTVQRIHKRIVDSRCRFWPARDLGLYAITTVAAARRNAPARHLFGQRRGWRALTEHQLAYAPTR